LSSILFVDDNSLLVGTVDGAVLRIDATSLKTGAERATSRGAVTCLGELPGSGQFLVGHLGGDIQRLSHDLQALGELEIDLASPIVALLPEPSGDTFVYLCWDGTWGRGLVPERASAAPLSHGKLDGVLRGGVLLSSNLLATAGPGEDVAIVDLDRGRAIAVLPGNGAGDVVAICHWKGSEIVTASRNGMVRRWDWEQRLKLDEVKLEKQIQSLATLPEENRWFAGDEIGAVHLGEFPARSSNR
jgi:WD40 repeat protein